MRPVITTDGNQTLAVIERFKQVLSDNPKDFPTLTAAQHELENHEEPGLLSRVG